jgi:hypothetical protein
MPAELVLSTGARSFAQWPVHGHYWADLFPGSMISGLGLALAQRWLPY